MMRFALSFAWVVSALLMLLLHSNTALATKALNATQASAVLTLSNNTPQQGSFTQHKYFKILKKPFVSQGTFVVNADDFLWQTLTPAKSAILFEQDTLYIEEAGVKKPMPQALGFATIIRLLISGDFSALESEFIFTGAATAHCIQLTPKDSEVSNVISAMTLCGQGQVEKITLIDAQQNNTDIMLSYNTKAPAIERNGSNAQD